MDAGIFCGIDWSPGRGELQFDSTCFKDDDAISIMRLFSDLFSRATMREQEKFDGSIDADS